MRIAFMGTPDFAVPSLDLLVSSGNQVVGVVCQPDKPAGRGKKLSSPPVKLCAEQHHLPVFQPEKLRSPEPLETIAAWHPDLIVVAAYGKILPPALLALPPRGCINVHASLLPKYRGAAPIQWALLRGEESTGITIMDMNERMDEGDVLLQAETPIGAGETYGELQSRLARLGAETLLDALLRLEAGTLQRRPQDHSAATLAPRIEKEQGRIDWTAPAIEIERKVRAFNPWPSAFTSLDGHQLKIHRSACVAAAASGAAGTLITTTPELVVSCGREALRLDEVQLAGRQRLAGAVFARGARLQPGARLGS